MKKVVALLLAIALSPVVMAQDRNVRLDLFGAANVVGASYDARFKGDSGLGFAVGVGYGFGIGNWYEIHGVGVPVEINYLAGRGKHHFEIGAGMSNGVYFDKITESKTVTLPDGSTGTAPKEVRTTQWGNFLYANVGYRLRARERSGVPLRLKSIVRNREIWLVQVRFLPIPQLGIFLLKRIILSPGSHQRNF